MPKFIPLSVPMGAVALVKGTVVTPSEIELFSRLNTTALAPVTISRMDTAFIGVTSIALSATNTAISLVGVPVSFSGLTTLTFNVSYHPTTAFAEDPISVVIAFSDGSTKAIPIVAIPVEMNIISITPTTLSFPNTLVGAVSALQTITVANTSINTALLITAIGVESEFSYNEFNIVQTIVTPITILPTESYPLDIVFAPTNNSVRAITLKLFTNVGVYSVPITGTGINAQGVTLPTPESTYTPEPEFVSSPIVIGVPYDYYVGFTNTTIYAFVVTSAVILNDITNEFVFAAYDALVGTVIAPGGSIEILVRRTPLTTIAITPLLDVIGNYSSNNTPLTYNDAQGVFYLSTSVPTVLTV